MMGGLRACRYAGKDGSVGKKKVSQNGAGEEKGLFSGFFAALMTFRK